MTRKQAHTLTLTQVKQVLGVMRYPEREMALISILTSMNVAEICGLQWKYVNLTDTWSNQDGEPIPPRTIAVRQEWYLGELGSVNGKSRHRNLPIPIALLPILSELKLRPNFTAPDDFVLVSRAGTPINETNIAARRLKPIGKALEMPWLTWQVFRRTHTALPYLPGNGVPGIRRAGANRFIGSSTIRTQYLLFSPPHLQRQDGYRRLRTGADRYRMRSHTIRMVKDGKINRPIRVIPRLH